MYQSNNPITAATVAVAIDPTALQEIIQDLIAAASKGLVTSTTITKYSKSIDPYNTNSMDVKKKDGKYKWTVVTKIMDGWKLVTINVRKTKNLMDPLKDRNTQLGLDPMMMVSTSVTGAIKAIPCTISGEDYWDAEIPDFKSVIVDTYVLILYQV